ncbi:hypothetical protein Mpsy_1078 [Methanolobus psychrophilus R15]|nr:hypothetical protein Mpsy_1078 [Methanolobus psychrophilus R15]
MNLKKLIIVAMLIIVSTSCVVAAEQLSKYEATKIATLYTYENEFCEAYGPYEYNHNYYYVCSILQNNALKTQIVIDAGTGDVVTNENTAKYIIKHNLALYYLYDEGSYQLDIDNADVYRQNANTYKSDYEFWISIRDLASTAEQKQNAQNAADISQSIMLKYENLLNATERIIEVKNKVKSGRTVQNAKDILEAEESSYYAEKQLLTSLDDAIVKTPLIYDNILKSTYLYGISKEEWNTYRNNDITTLKYSKDIRKSNIAYWESMENDISSDAQWYYESMMDRVQEFEAVNKAPSFTLSLSCVALL